MRMISCECLGSTCDAGMNLKLVFLWPCWLHRCRSGEWMRAGGPGGITKQEKGKGIESDFTDWF